MLRFKIRNLALTLVLLAFVAACNNNSGDSGNQGASGNGGGAGTGGGGSTNVETPSGDDYYDGSQYPNTEISGRVVYGDYDWNDSINHDRMIEQFNELYPNIEVVREWTTWNLPESLTALATAGALPHVAIGWEGLPFYASQGWLYPLDDFVANDPDMAFVPDHLLDAYRFLGQLYAVPAYLQFNGILINLDLLDQLNEDPPDYTWTIDEFIRLANLATTTTTSGITWTNFHETFPGMLSRDLSAFGFNPTQYRFDFTNPAWAETINFDMALRQTPGLFSDHLRNDALRDAGELDDYQRKFGEGADALRDGLVLMAPTGTWDGWIMDLPFNFDVWPLPHDPSIGFTLPAHTDFGFMLSSAEAPEAAYAFLRYMTTSVQGWLDRLVMFSEFIEVSEDGTETHAPRTIVPVSTHPDVQNLFRETTAYKPGFVYQHSRLDESWRADYAKTIPNFWPILEPYWSIRDQILAGETTAAAVASELNRLVNENMEREMAIFDDTMRNVQANFQPR